jgi:3',5'-cyclic AMP phosphodiesterase CpdA
MLDTKPNVEKQLKDLRLAHLSDCHIGFSPQHDDMISDSIANLNKKNIDHLIISGDLTDTGLEGEIEKLNDMLTENGFSSAERLTVIPGNHDLFTFFYRYFHRPSEFKSNIKHLAKTLYRVYRYNWQDYQNDLQRFATAYHYAFDDIKRLGDTPLPFPFLKEVGELVTLIGLDSNRLLPTVRNNPVCAKGYIDLQRTEKLLQQAGGNDRIKIAVLHHQLLPETRLIEQLGKRFSFAMRLDNCDAFVDLLRRYDVRMVLHGHYHAKQQYLLDRGRLNVINNGKAGACSIVRIDDHDVEIESLDNAPLTL